MRGCAITAVVGPTLDSHDEPLAADPGQLSTRVILRGLLVFGVARDREIPIAVKDLTR